MTPDGTARDGTPRNATAPYGTSWGATAPGGAAWGATAPRGTGWDATAPVGFERDGTGRDGIAVGRRRSTGWSSWLLLVAVGTAFADTSVVALALPRIYGEFATSIVTVSWVLTGYAAAVTVVAAGIALAPRVMRPVLLVAAGLAVLAGSCLVAGFARGLTVLLVARCCQGVGAALLLGGTLPVLAAAVGGRAGRRAWTAAAALGLAAGPALGGVLTQLFDWRSIFLVQVPVALAGLLALADPRIRTRSAPGELRPPGAGSVLGLVLLSGSLVGALFLGVLLVVEVWRLTPLGGAGVVGALPVGMLLARAVTGRSGPVLLLLAGVPALAGGLTALALLPAATPGWAMAALLVCGIGWGMLDTVFDRDTRVDEDPAVGRDTRVDEDLAVGRDHLVGRGRRSGRDRTGVRAGGLATAARHAGLVLGLLLIAPVLSAALDGAAGQSALAGTSLVLDARLPVAQKVAVAGALRDGLATGSQGSVPDVAALVDRSGGGPAVRELGVRLAARLREVLTRAFRGSFGIAAGLAAGTLIPGVLVLLRRRSRPDRDGRTGPPAGHRSPGGRDRRLPGPVQAAVALAVVAGALALPAAEVAAGAVRFGGVALADPCRAGPDPYPGGGLDAVEQKVVLSALNGAACSLHVSREALVLSLDGRARAGSVPLTRGRLDPALRAGLSRAVDDAERRGDLPGLAAFALREVVARAPVDWLADQLGLPHT